MCNIFESSSQKLEDQKGDLKQLGPPTALSMVDKIALIDSYKKMQECPLHISPRIDKQIKTDHEGLIQFLQKWYAR